MILNIMMRVKSVDWFGDKNKNPNLEKKLEQEKKLNAVIDSLKVLLLPVNMNPEKVKEISKSFSKDENVLKIQQKQ